MSARWTGTDYWRAQKRSAEGYVEVKPDLRKRGAHKNPYLFHAAAYCRQLGVPEPEAEVYPLPDREFRLDLAWREQRIGLECQGGIFTQGAHSRGAGIERDIEKLNLCVAAGWRLFYTTPRKLPEVIMLIANTFLR